MASFEIVSPKHGMFTVLVDDEDYERVMSAGSWCISFKGRKTKVPDVTMHIRGMGRCKGNRIALHIFVMGRKGIDHINGNRLDNRKENLRAVTQGQNTQNMGVSVRNKSGYRGVTWSQQRQKWCAHLRINGKSTNLGRFDTKEAAYEAVKAARAKHMPYSVEARCLRAEA